MTNMSAKIRVPRGMTLSELELKIDEANIPDSAQVEVYVTKGDRPWESDDTQLHFRWEV